MHTPTTELKYEIVSEEAFIYTSYLNIDFVVDGKKYTASCVYVFEKQLTDVFVEDENSNELDEDSDIYKLGYELLEYMEMNHKNLTW